MPSTLRTDSIRLIRNDIQSGCEIRCEGNRFSHTRIGKALRGFRHRFHRWRELQVFPTENSRESRALPESKCVSVCARPPTATANSRG